jgi:tRNA dimethylallyltransferase
MVACFGMKVQKPQIIAVVGPTASGKTGLSVELAKAVGGEVISADSRQVYRGLDIGTGKVTKREARGIPHHLINIASPKKHISVDVWKKKAEKALNNIIKRGKTPIVCGGTGLYVDTLLRGLSFPTVSPNLALRKRLEKKPVEELYVLLKKLDPTRARNIDRRNPRRLIRAIEIAKALGHVPSKKIIPPPYQIDWIGINPPDTILKKNIHHRLLARLSHGMVAEAKKLHRTGLSYKRMRDLGLEYRFLADLLEHHTPKKAFVDSLEQAIWQYAKRQRTWWKRYNDISWFDSPDNAFKYFNNRKGGGA